MRQGMKLYRENRGRESEKPVAGEEKQVVKVLN